MNKELPKICEHCDNLIAIGDGDFICLELREGDDDECIMPISDYSPTDDYLKCSGKKWE